MSDDQTPLELHKMLCSQIDRLSEFEAMLLRRMQDHTGVKPGVILNTHGGLRIAVFRTDLVYKMATHHYTKADRPPMLAVEGVKITKAGKLWHNRPCNTVKIVSPVHDHIVGKCTLRENERTTLHRFDVHIELEFFE